MQHFHQRLAAQRSVGGIGEGLHLGYAYDGGDQMHAAFVDADAVFGLDLERTVLAPEAERYFVPIGWQQVADQPVAVAQLLGIRRNACAFR